MYNMLKALGPYITQHKSKVIGSLLLSFVLAAIKGYQVRLVKPIFDEGLSGSFNNALHLALILFALGLLNFPARFFHFYWIRFVVDSATCTLRSIIFNKLQKLPMSFYGKSKQGNLISSILNDTQTFSQGVRNAIDLVREPITALVMLGSALYTDWQLTLVIFVVAPLFVLIFNISGKKVRKNQANVQEDLSQMTHNISEGISAQKITKSFNLQNYVLRRFENSQNKFFRAILKTTKVEELAHPFVELVGALAFSGVILFAWYRISHNIITMGDFISFITALALLMDPIRKYSQANVRLNQASAARDRIVNLLETPNEVDAGTYHLKSFADKIEIKNLTFSYGEGEVIKDLSLTIKKGEKAALVGLSGSGKSTLINLLLGLYPIKEGDILIDGHSIADISLQSLRELFGLVSQDIFLFHDTIGENITLGEAYTKSQIDECLQIAYAEGFIKDLPQGMDTVVGDRGTRLSGGQQQRITIARAYLKNTPILLFDEATSALDNESEKVVQQALDKMAGEKTVIAVAHRLSTIQHYDSIYVLHSGRLIESGTHHELMNNRSEYSKLYQLSL